LLLARRKVGSPQNGIDAKLDARKAEGQRTGVGMMELVCRKAAVAE